MEKILQEFASSVAELIGKDIPTGTALEQTLISFTFFVFFQSFCVLALSKTKLAKSLDTDGKFRLYNMPVAALHALGAIFFALTLANGPDDVLLSKDKINGTTALASICHSFSCGFFLFDVIVVLHHDPFDVKFFLHAIVCGAAYWLAQKPLFQYFTVRFLFYEISTPLIYVRMYLVLSKAPKMLTNLVGYMFGVAFIGCRLIYGLPLSYDFVMYLLHLIKDRPQQCLSSSIKNNDCVGFEGLPNDTILYFCIFAVCSMAALNVLWFVITLVSPPQPDELHEGAKIKVPKAPNHPQNNSTRKQKKN